ncbi:MAG TPA: hypothetical protein VFB62_13645, partial [Polyangiaceae bacterium]|nr:hypothetical protein [Polyangiaceae bacterium]
GVPGALLSKQKTRWPIVVRRLALAAEKADTTIVLLSSIHTAREQLLPVAMRLELSHPARDRLGLRIARDRRGRAAGPFSIPLLRAG